MRGTIPSIVAIAGPTASGKTALALELSRRLDGEIISCDSMQIYRGMDIGTAKPTREELAAVPHHLIDIVEPGCDFSCADYKARADAAIMDIAARGKRPVFCGGTGLYLDVVLHCNNFSSCGENPEYRELLWEKDNDTLHAMLYEIDPEAAEAIHKNNKKRVVRALEIFHETGITKTEWDRRSRVQKPEYDFTVIGLDFHDRGLLYDRINRRVDLMLEQGLLEEVKRLDLGRSSNAGQAIGYKELYEYLDGHCSFAQAVEKIKTASRNYAKRQLTWFCRREYIKWMYVDGYQNTGNKNEKNSFEEIVNNSLLLLTD